VPELSRFFGIVIRMFTEIGGPHRLQSGLPAHPIEPLR